MPQGGIAILSPLEGDLLVGGEGGDGVDGDRLRDAAEPLGNGAPDSAKLQADGPHYDAFLSYAREDARFVDRLHADLTTQGLPAWRDVRVHPRGRPLARPHSTRIELRWRTWPDRLQEPAGGCPGSRRS